MWKCHQRNDYQFYRPEKSMLTHYYYLGIVSEVARVRKTSQLAFEKTQFGFLLSYGETSQALSQKDKMWLKH